MMKNKRKLQMLILSFLCLTGFYMIFSVHTSAASSNVYYHNRLIATTDSDGVMTYVPSNDNRNATYLNYILNNDDPKTLIIPEDATVKISQVIKIGSNTTIDATGATIIQTNAGVRKGLIKNEVDGYNYNAIHDVTIIGGTWKKQRNTTVTTFMRFAHGKNLKFKDLTIISNYQSHGIELIACRDSLISNCTIKAENNGTKSYDSVEDAIQIDVATPITAPGVYSETKSKKYVNGQICKNITVTGCNIYGARGICANYASKEVSFKNSYHRDITITNNTITGATSQGIALYNTIGCLIQGNVIKTTSTRENLAYPSGINLYLFGTKIGGQNRIINNKIYGMKRGIYTNSKRGSYYGRAIISGNMIYVKKGLKGARCLDLKYCRYTEQKNNRLGQW